MSVMLLLNMHSFFVVMTLWNGAWGLFLQFPHIFCCPYPSTVKVDLGRHFDFSFYEGRVLLLVRIQIHYLLTLWSILQCIAAIRNTNIMVDHVFCSSEQTCFFQKYSFLDIASLEEI